MTHSYNISGMTCNGCVAKVKNELLKIGAVTEAEVQLTAPQATIGMTQHIPLATLQEAVHKAGNYTITATAHEPVPSATEELRSSWLGTYKPVLLIFFYVTLVSIIAATTAGSFHIMRAMNVFMAGFFLAFSFFKLLSIKSFADSYAMYDIIARRFRAWGLIYPFVELGLGIAYATGYEPLLTNAITFFVMSISIVGVLQSVLSKKQIKCACLGAVFNLPMSTVTIIEDALMIVMSGAMLAFLL